MAEEQKIIDSNAQESSPGVQDQKDLNQPAETGKEFSEDKSPGETENNSNSGKSNIGPPQSTIDVQIKKGIKGNAEFANYIHKEINNIIGGEGVSPRMKKFSISRTIPIPEDKIEEAAETFVYPVDKIEELSSILNSNRMLLLTGDAESGKYFTAIYLTTQLDKENKKKYDVRLVKPLAKESLIDLFELTGNPELLKNKILIFKDVFSGENQNLIEFFTSYAKEQTRLFSKNLKEKDAYILFTADDDKIEEYRLSSLDIKIGVLPIEGEFKKKGFELQLKHFCNKKQENFDFNKAYDSLKEDLDGILEQLGSMSKISFFIENYLGKILAGDINIEKAIDEVNNIEKHVEYWFLTELGENNEEFEAWTFTLFLALLNGASYADFGLLHKEITKKLLRVLTPYSPDKGFSFTRSESKLLKKCKAQVTRSVDIYADIIEFCDPRYQKALSEILFEKNRRILIDIIPYLQNFAENSTYPPIRRMAACSIGRIGELDLDSITLYLIKKWGGSSKDEYKANVGYLFEGILQSKDENYKKYCMGYLKQMALNNDHRIQWTAISAYKQIGLHNLELAMKELRKIQEQLIAQVLETENILDFLYRKGAEIEAILQNFDKLYEKTNYLWGNIRNAVTALCIMREPIEVISELGKWIKEGNRNSKITVALFFLGIYGILYAMENWKGVHPSDDEDKNSLSSNDLLNSLTGGTEAIKKMAHFLNDLYEKCFSKFPVNDQKILINVLFSHLEKWVIDTLSKTKVSKALKELILKLYDTGGKDLKRVLWDSLKHWKIPEREEKKEDEEEEKKEKKKEEEKKVKLKKFVADVSEQIFGV